MSSPTSNPPSPASESPDAGATIADLEQRVAALEQWRDAALEQWRDAQINRSRAAGLLAQLMTSQLRRCYSSPSKDSTPPCQSSKPSTASTAS